MRVEFSTVNFQFTHGKIPRGYGQWFFFFNHNDDQPFMYTGKFSEAKKMAVAYAVTKGYTHVSVGS